MSNGNSDVKLVHGQVKVEAWDLCLDSSDRRKNATDFRRALVHDFEDGLTVNWDNDYPNGVTLKGVRTIEGKDLGPITKTVFPDTLEFHGPLDCWSTMRFIANAASWTKISYDSSQRLVFENKTIGEKKDIVFETPVLTHELGLNGQAHMLLTVGPGGVSKPPADLLDEQFKATGGTSLATVLVSPGQMTSDSIIKVDAVDAIATLTDMVMKLQAQIQQSQSQVNQLMQEVSDLKAQLANAQDHWRLCTKCQGLFYPDSPSAKQHTCPAGGVHEASGNYRLLQ
jgi:hypothetical protein